MNSLIYGELPGAVFPFEFYNGVVYHCVAADKLGFSPKLIFEK